MVRALERLVAPATLGDPMRPLLWVSKSLEKIAMALAATGHKVSPATVRKELTRLGFSRQSNRKADEGSHHPDRNAQFEHINARVLAAQGRGQPVIWVDTEKKELVGNFKNGGTDWRPKGDPQRVNVHDFEDKTLGKVVPYGVYDVAANAGFVSVGITSDTAEFAVASIRCWLERVGCERYPEARELTITADAVAATVRGCGCGSWSCSGLPTRVALPSMSTTIRPAPPSGTNRTPAVLPHHADLARAAADRPPRRGRTDRRDYDQDRAQGRQRARHAHLREGRQGLRRRDGQPAHHRRRLPPGMELHRQPTQTVYNVAVIGAAILR